MNKEIRENPVKVNDERIDEILKNLDLSDVVIDENTPGYIDEVLAEVFKGPYDFSELNESLAELNEPLAKEPTKSTVKKGKRVYLTTKRRKALGIPPGVKRELTAKEINILKQKDLLG